MATHTETKTSRSHNRGFAAMPADQQRAIASLGGIAAHAKGTAHEFTPEEARKAGRKGGQAVSRDHAHMAEIGREGGKQSRGGRSRHENEGTDSRAGTGIQGPYRRKIQGH